MMNMDPISTRYTPVKKRSRQNQGKSRNKMTE